MQSRPWLTLLACLAAAGSAAAQDDAALPAAAPGAGAGSGSGLGLGIPWPDFEWTGMPPVLTTGMLSYDFRAARNADEPNSVAHLLTGAITARSYIYEPWFATVNGSLRLTTAWSRAWGGLAESGSGFSLAQGPQSSRENFFTGNARIDVFPRSRFPFEIHVERTDSRVDSGMVSTIDFRTLNIGFSQRYRPEKGEWSAGAGYDFREQSGAGFRHAQNTFTGDYSTRWKHNDLSLSGSYSHASAGGGASSGFGTVVARHGYAADNNMSVNTTVNLTRTDESGGALTTELTVLQLTSIGLWQRPTQGMSLTGSVRGLVLHDAANGTDFSSLGATLGGSWEVNPNVRLAGNATANLALAEGQASHGWGGSVSASWQGDTLKYKALSYDRFAGVSVGTSTTGGENAETETQVSASANVGHTLNLSWKLSPQSMLMLSGSQTLSGSAYRSDAPPLAVPGASPVSATPQSARTLVQMASATWTMSGGRSSAYARLSFSDSRELGGGHARFQLANFQLSGTFEFDGNRSLGGDLTVQRVLQRTADAWDGTGLRPPERTGSTSASGEITFRQRRLFGVPRLTFTSRLKLAQDVLHQPGNFPSIPDRETAMWENRLDWNVGRLETQLVLRLSEVDGKRRDVLLWRLQRHFGE